MFAVVFISKTIISLHAWTKPFGGYRAAAPGSKVLII